ncbi:ADP-ribosylglycohydrolase family protein [Naasia sp. SYSU D00948]|uniref:ADP-ribosylglycohydrolase family protein n=1 Tax=Naasia sp. SYSU D00948 TaxID=2817379 RepID=UPI0035A98025
MRAGGGFGWARGEWTDDTAMAVPLLKLGAIGGGFGPGASLDGVVSQWAGWSRTAKDVGIQTRRSSVQ